jgi:hypothetical protein
LIGGEKWCRGLVAATVAAVGFCHIR